MMLFIKHSRLHIEDTQHVINGTFFALYIFQKFIKVYEFFLEGKFEKL